MGKKKDALKARIAELEEENKQLHHVTMEQHETMALARTGAGSLGDDTALAVENDELRRRIAELSSERPLVLVTDKHDAPAPIRQQIAAALGVELKDGEVLTDEGILEAIGRIKGDDKNPSDELGSGSKRDSLAEAVHANQRERYELAQLLTRSQGIVTRVAAALCVSEWDKDGSEIIEKAQRFENLRYWIRKRIQECNAEIAANDGRDAVWSAVGAELRTILGKLLAAKDLAAWLDKLSVKTPATPAIAELAAESPASTTSAHPWLEAPFTVLDVADIFGALATYGAVAEEGVDVEMRSRDRVDQLVALVGAIDAEPKVRDEFVGIMNVFVIPMLKKIRQQRGLV